jgi:hypothetical protein
MPDEPKVSAEQVIEAIKGTGGIKTVIAQKLGVVRMSVDRYLKRWPSVLEAYEAEAESVGDMAESVVVTNIKLALEHQREFRTQQDGSDARWYLARKCRDRGFADRTEITGAEGEPLIPISLVTVHRAMEGDGE